MPSRSLYFPLPHACCLMTHLSVFFQTKIHSLQFFCSAAELGRRSSACLRLGSEPACFPNPAHAPPASGRTCKLSPPITRLHQSACRWVERCRMGRGLCLLGTSGGGRSGSGLRCALLRRQRPRCFWGKCAF